MKGKGFLEIMDKSFFYEHEVKYKQNGDAYLSPFISKKKLEYIADNFDINVADYDLDNPEKLINDLIEKSKERLSNHNIKYCIY